MVTRVLLSVLLLGFWVGGAAPVVNAQIVYGSPSSGGLRVEFTNWTITPDSGAELSIYQVMVPISAYVPIRDNLEMTVFVANSTNILNTPESDYSLTGFNNASLQVSQSLGEDHFLISGGVNLPTGKTKLNYDEEIVILGVLSESFLQMPMTRFGEGLGFNLLLGGAAMLGDNVRGGAGVAYQYTGSYEPYKDFTDYNPGDLFAVNVGIDMGTDSARAALDVVYTLYSNDTRDGNNTFRQSPQIDFRLSGFRSNGSVTLSGLLRYLKRGENKEFDDQTHDELTPLQFYGNEFGAAGGASFKLGNRFYAGPAIEVRTISESDIEGSSTVYGGGVNFSAGAGNSVAITGGGMYHTGTANGGKLDLTGISVSLGLTARF